MKEKTITSLEEPSLEKLEIETTDDSSSLLISEASINNETLVFYENALALELVQTSLLIVIFITVLLSGIYKIGR